MKQMNEQQIDFSDVAEPVENAFARARVRLIFATLERHQRRFIAGAQDAAPNYDPQLVAHLCRTRYQVLLFIGLTQHTKSILALHFQTAEAGELCLIPN